jgi:signal transduction histidine kinase
VNRRILAAVLAVTTLAVAAFFVPAALAIRSAQRRGELLELQREAAKVANQLSVLDRSDDVTALQPITSSNFRLGLYAIDGHLIGGIGPPRADTVVALALAGNFAEKTEGSELVAAVPVQIAATGAVFVVRIEAPQNERQDRFRRSLLALAAEALAVIASAGLVGVWLSRRLNRPIVELTAWAADGRAQRAPPEATGVDEIDALRDALVDDRRRIDELLRRERSFSSHVSHQLRTPVAAMRVAIETEQTAPRPDPRLVLGESLGQLDRLESTINSLLALARHADRRPIDVDLTDRVAAALGPWTLRASQLGRELALDGEPIAARIDADAVDHILDVLVDNALRHGAGAITIVSRATQRTAMIDVLDEGVAPSLHDPFAEAGDDASHGIGLRLARSLAEALGGTLELLERPTTAFRLTLPLQPPLS